MDDRDIQRMRSEGLTGRQIVHELVKNRYARDCVCRPTPPLLLQSLSCGRGGLRRSTSFATKTPFSQAKYIKRKIAKYCVEVRETPRLPTQSPPPCCLGARPTHAPVPPRPCTLPHRACPRAAQHPCGSRTVVLSSCANLAQRKP